MTISKLPSGHWRARIWLNGKDVSVAQIVGSGPSSFATKRDARDAYDQARRMLRGGAGDSVTVGEFWKRWTSDPIFARPKKSTNRHNRERTRAFAERYGTVALDQVGRRVVNEWLTGGQRTGTVPALRAMFADAQRYELTDRNPFAKLGIAKTRGNADVKPPSEDVVWELIRAARRISGPSFAAWLQVAAFTGIRPGELDALRWDAVDFDRDRILVAEQYTPTGFSLPKNGRRRWAPLTQPAREALTALPRDASFCFVNLRGEHWTAPARAYHFKAAKAAVGYAGTLYLATRHFAGWYMTNVLGLSAEDVAKGLGHTDGGYLVRTLYGHLDEELALGRVVDAYRERGNVRPLPRRDQETG